MEQQSVQFDHTTVIDHDTVISEDVVVYENERLIITGGNTKVILGGEKKIRFVNEGTVEIDAEIILKNCIFSQNSQAMKLTGLMQILGDSELILGESAEASAENSGTIVLKNHAKIQCASEFNTAFLNTGVIQMMHDASVVTGQRAGCSFINKGIIQKLDRTVLETGVPASEVFQNMGMVQTVPGFDK